MKALIERLHSRVGDLWWYSAMIFLACRSGDAIQAFIGLWLVPKYVGPQELGAVLPIQQLAGFFTVPLAVLTVVFTKYVNAYATRGERGKVKSFVRDVIRATALLFLLCIVGAHFLIPHFYERLHIGAGSLTILVLAAGFTCNLLTLLNGALQGLKQFKTITVLSILGSPIRLVTLLVAMPYRALSGYMLGQTMPALAGCALSIRSIRRDLKDVPVDTSWRRDIPEILRYLWPIAVYTVGGTVCATISATVYRQRLPEIESSANYLLSRFAEMAGYLGIAISAVLVPLASEAHEQGRKNLRILKQSVIGCLGFSGLLALLFSFFAPYLFTLNDTWAPYADYVWLLPVMTLTIGLSTTAGTVLSYEMACQRFKLVFLFLALNVLSLILFICVAGIGYFDGMLPKAVLAAVDALHFNHITPYTLYALVTTALTATILLVLAFRNHPEEHHD